MKQVQWVYRPQMLKRGKRMLSAHWRNLCSGDDLDRWFMRNIYKHAKITTRRANERPDFSRIKDRFWTDVEKAVITEDHGLTWKEWTS